MEDILYPSKIELRDGTQPHEAVLTVEPCTQGYGTTVGNALRRVLLTSLPGAAITAVRIKGVQHEFSGMPNVKEDVLELVLNLKQVRLKCYSEEPVKLSLNVTGEKKVTAGDFEKNSDIEIVNPDLHIATLTDKKAVLEMEVTIERGRGYRPTEERSKEKMELGTIAVDALFSPVRNVGFAVENVRVGDVTNFDKLVMTIETDGSITPKEAVLEANKIVLRHFALINDLEGSGAAAVPVDVAADDTLMLAAPAEAESPAEDGEDKPKKKTAKKKAS
ncbi:DNA-directed RNA polymerase subunit alpha [Patescibacteria group bacterium]|nr:MAG: DNA-directed RNA polymerase subunit alpha [Patescibacteria group bacterium]